MAQYFFVGPCGRKTAIQPSQAGQVLKCACGAEHTLPTMLEIARLEPAATVAEVVPRHAWALRERLLFLGAVTFLMGLAMAGAIGWTWPPVPSPATPDRIRSQIDSLTVVQTLHVWADLLRGLEGRPRREERFYQEEAAWARRWLYVAGAIVLAGLATMGSALLANGHSATPGEIGHKCPG